MQLKKEKRDANAIGKMIAGIIKEKNQCRLMIMRIINGNDRN